MEMADKFDRIRAYMLGHLEFTELSEPEQRQHDRWVQMGALSNSHYDANEAIKQHLILQKQKGQPITERTAWTDYRNGLKLFGEQRALAFETKLRLLESWATQTFKMAVEEKDIKAMNASIKNLRELANDLKSVEEKQNDDIQASKFVMLLQYDNEADNITIDLDDWQELPSDINDKLISAIETNHLKGASLHKAFEK